MPPMTQSMGADIEGAGVERPAYVPPATQTAPPPPAAPPSSDTYFTVEQIEKARAEERSKVQAEKDRLRSKFKETEQELEALRKAMDEQKKEQERMNRAKAAKERRAREKDMSAKDILEEREKEWEQRFSEQQARFAQLEAQAALERQAQKLENYIVRRVSQEQAAKTIAPQFVDYITGSSEEEVEASIELAKQKTAEIAAEVSQQLQGYQAQPQGQPRGVSVSSGPANFGSQTDIRDDDIDYTTLSMKDYLEKVRPKLGIGGGGQGLFS